MIDNPICSVCGRQVRRTVAGNSWTHDSISSLEIDDCKRRGCYGYVVAVAFPLDIDDTSPRWMLSSIPGEPKVPLNEAARIEGILEELMGLQEAVKLKDAAAIAAQDSEAVLSSQLRYIDLCLAQRPILDGISDRRAKIEFLCSDNQRMEAEIKKLSKNASVAI